LLDFEYGGGMSIRIEPLNVTGPSVLVDTVEPERVLVVPVPIVGHVDDGALPWDVTVRVGFASTDDPTLICEEITVRRRPGGPAASAAEIRGVPVGDLVDEMIRRAGTVMTRSVDQSGRMTLAIASEDDYTPKDGDVFRAKTRRRHNSPLPEKRREALRLHEYAKHSPDVDGDPLTWVAEQLGVSRSTAHNYVRKAKES
jgi:hypothetical protein